MTKKEKPRYPNQTKTRLKLDKLFFEDHFQALPQSNKTQKSRKTKPNQKIRFLRIGQNQNQKRKTINENETKS